MTRRLSSPPKAEAERSPTKVTSRPALGFGFGFVSASFFSFSPLLLLLELPLSVTSSPITTAAPRPFARTVEGWASSGALPMRRVGGGSAALPSFGVGCAAGLSITVAGIKGASLQEWPAP